MGVWIILIMLVAVALAAPRYGADTRTADSWTAGRGAVSSVRDRASVRADVAALRRLLIGLVRPAR